MPHAKGGRVNCFIKKIPGKKLKKKLPRARPRGAPARGGDEATTFTAVEPSRHAP
jgi:hypothetical protein